MIVIIFALSPLERIFIIIILLIFYYTIIKYDYILLLSPLERIVQTRPIWHCPEVTREEAVSLATAR